MTKIAEPIRNKDVERKVLSCLAYDPKVWHAVSGRLTQYHFWHKTYRLIFRTIVSLIEDEEEVNESSIAARLDKHNKLEEVGGESTIEEVTDEVHFPDEADPLVDLLDDYYQRRRYQQAGLTVASGLARGSMDVDEAFDTLSSELEAQKINSGIDLGVNLDEGLDAWQDRQEQLWSGKEEVHKPTKIKPVDEVLGGGMCDGRFYILAGLPKTGKALKVGTPIPTPDGFKPIEDLEPGDQVFGADGRTCNVIAKSPIWKDRPLYRVTTRTGCELVVDENHDWSVKTYRGGPFVTMDTKTMWKRRQQINRRIPIPRQKPVQHPAKDLPVDPWVLGYWLGDGRSDGCGFTTSKEDQPFIRKKIEEAGYTTTEWESTPLSYGALGLKVKLRKLGLLKNKNIPDTYLRSSIAQRKELLKGLIDSDGHIESRNGVTTFCTTNPSIAEDFKILVRSLGMRVSSRVDDATIYGKVCGKRYRFSLVGDDTCSLPRKRQILEERQASNYERYGRFERSVDRHVDVEKAGRGDTVCIEVDSDDNLFLAGKGFIPTHNSKLAIAMCLNLMKYHNYHVEFWYTDGPASAIFTEMVAAEGGIKTSHLNAPRKVGKSERDDFFRKRDRAVQALRQYGSFEVYPKGSPKISTIVRTTKAVTAQQDRPVILVVDYLQNVTAGFEGDEFQEATTTSRSLASLRTDLGIIVLGLSQFNRHAAKGKKMPRPSQLRASGQLEQDVNDLLIFYRPYLDKPNASKDEKRLGRLWLAMSKHKEQEKVSLDTDLARNRFTTRSRATAPDSDYPTF